MVSYGKQHGCYASDGFNLFTSDTYGLNSEVAEGNSYKTIWAW